jgi:CTP:molybdopterin cytidylyltransferase MocA
VWARCVWDAAGVAGVAAHGGWRCTHRSTGQPVLGGRRVLREWQRLAGRAGMQVLMRLCQADGPARATHRLNVSLNMHLPCAAP